MLSEYLEEIDARRSVQSGYLSLRTRFYGDDFFGSSIPGSLSLFVLFLAAHGGSLGAGLLAFCFAGIALSGVAIASVQASYRLVEIPASPSQQLNRQAAVAAFKVLGWEVRRDNQQYLAGFREPRSLGRQVLVVVHGPGQVWFNCRGGTQGRFGRLPFQATRAWQTMDSFRSQFAVELGRLSNRKHG